MTIGAQKGRHYALADDSGRVPRAPRHVRGGGAAHAARPRRGRARCRSATFPHVIAAVEQRRGRRSASCRSRTRSRARSRSPSTRSRSTPSSSSSARSTCRSRCTSARRPGTKLADITHRRVVPAPARPVPRCGWPRSCPTPIARGRQLHRRGGASRWRSRSARTWRRSATRSRREHATASRCSPPRSRTTPRTRPASCSSGRGIPAPTGHDKTSIVCFQREDRPGSLLAILQEFAARAINLTKLESRPTKREPRRLLLLHRLRGPHRRRARRRLPAQPRGEAGRGEVPRLVPGRRADGGAASSGGAPRPRRGSTRRRGSTSCARRSATTSRVIDLKRLRDEPEYRARHRAQARARRV